MSAPASTVAPLRVLHDFSSLRRWGGMLRVFANLAPRLQALGVAQYLFARTHGMAPMASPIVASLAVPPGIDYAAGLLPLPRVPAVLRRWRRRALVRPWNLNAILNWGRFGNIDALWLARQLDIRAYYWEHGAAWLERRAPGGQFLHEFDGAIAVSEAARVMLHDRWGFGTQIKVIPNGVWDELRTAGRAAPVRSAAEGRTLRIGFAGRLVGFKGAALALHTLARVHKSGLQARLEVAGDGPDFRSLQKLAWRLGLAQDVVFLGYTSNMEAWYRQIDVLLHPALREPFGLICAEALCWGVPVVTVGIDGLPEVVEHGIDGQCVTPTLPLSEAGSLGFSLGRIPDLVYHAASRRLAPPLLPDPELLAQAVIRVAGELESLSRAVAPRARERFAIGRQAQALANTISSGSG